MFATLQRVTLVFSTYLPTYTNWLCVKVLEYDIFHTAAYIRVVYLDKFRTLKLFFPVCVLFSEVEKWNKIRIWALYSFHLSGVFYEVESKRVCGELDLSFLDFRTVNQKYADRQHEQSFESNSTRIVSNIHWKGKPLDWIFWFLVRRNFQNRFGNMGISNQPPDMLHINATLHEKFI